MAKQHINVPKVLGWKTPTDYLTKWEFTCRSNGQWSEGLNTVVCNGELKTQFLMYLKEGV